MKPGEKSQGRSSPSTCSTPWPTTARRLELSVADRDLRVVVERKGDAAGRRRRRLAVLEGDGQGRGQAHAAGARSAARRGAGVGELDKGAVVERLGTLRPLHQGEPRRRSLRLRRDAGAQGRGAAGPVKVAFKPLLTPLAAAARGRPRPSSPPATARCASRVRPPTATGAGRLHLRRRRARSSTSRTARPPIRRRSSSPSTPSSSPAST